MTGVVAYGLVNFLVLQTSPLKGNAFESQMDKERFYVEVAMSMAAAEACGDSLLGVLSVGIDRAEEFVRESELPLNE